VDVSFMDPSVRYSAGPAQKVMPWKP
jgi:hypothetical protein